MNTNTRSFVGTIIELAKVIKKGVSAAAKNVWEDAEPLIGPFYTTIVLVGLVGLPGAIVATIFWGIGHALEGASFVYIAYAILYLIGRIYRKFKNQPEEIEEIPDDNPEENPED